MRPLRLGLDFGTATTCIATVTDYAAFRPQVIPLDGQPFLGSMVFLDAPNGSRPLVSSDSVSGRAPMALFDEAERHFERFWQERVEVQGHGCGWSDWLEQRERTLLLTYFKPELADHPVRRAVKVPIVRCGRYDGLAQFEEVSVHYVEREVASPEPDTSDLVSSTAAIVRATVSAAVRQHGERVESLTIGMPSFGTTSDADEVNRARQRRLDAVAASGVREEFGTIDFRVEFLGEAQAAGSALDLEVEGAEAFALIVDVGAGTTDLALVPYRRDESRRLVAEAPILTHSERFAGRDLNLAIALALKADRKFRSATDLLDEYDPRAWQLVMDNAVEGVKCGLTHESRTFTIPFWLYAAHVDGVLYNERRARTLRAASLQQLHLGDENLKAAVRKACRTWRESVRTFLEEASRTLGSSDRAKLVAVELVGGAFRFEPLRLVLDSAVRMAGLSDVPVRYRNAGAEAQTAVARGLARAAAMS